MCIKTQSSFPLPALWMKKFHKKHVEKQVEKQPPISNDKFVF